MVAKPQALTAPQRKQLHAWFDAGADGPTAAKKAKAAGWTVAPSTIGAEKMAWTQLRSAGSLGAPVAADLPVLSSEQDARQRALAACVALAESPQVEPRVRVEAARAVLDATEGELEGDDPPSNARPYQVGGQN